MSEVDDLELRIAKLALAPDDVLVVKIDRVVSTEMFQRVASYVRSALGDDVRKILVIDSEVDLSVITREQAAQVGGFIMTDEQAGEIQAAISNTARPASTDS